MNIIGDPKYAERVAFLRSKPIHVCVNWISDAASDEIGITATTFAIGMEPLFRTTTPLELLDLCSAIIREKVVAREHKLDKTTP